MGNKGPGDRSGPRVCKLNEGKKKGDSTWFLINLAQEWVAGQKLIWVWYVQMGFFAWSWCWGTWSFETSVRGETESIAGEWSTFDLYHLMLCQFGSISVRWPPRGLNWLAWRKSGTKDWTKQARTDQFEPCLVHWNFCTPLVFLRGMGDCLWHLKASFWIHEGIG